MGYNSPRAILHSRLPIALKAPHWPPSFRRTLRLKAKLKRSSKGLLRFLKSTFRIDTSALSVG